MQKNSFWGAFEGCFGPMGKTNHENVGKQMENLRGRLGFFLPIWDKMKAKVTVLTSITFRYLILTSRCKKLIWAFLDQQLLHDKDWGTASQSDTYKA